MSKIIVQNTIVAVCVMSLFLTAGCNSTQSGGKPKNVFSWPKVTKKQEERATQTSMEQILRQPRVNAHP